MFPGYKQRKVVMCALTSNSIAELNEPLKNLTKRSLFAALIEM